MADVTYIDHQIANWQGTSVGSRVVTKPTGLAVGDLMIAMFGVAGITSLTATPPSGFNSATDQSSTAGSDGRLVTWTKFADASDVAASNFTFSPSGTTSSADDSFAAIFAFRNVSTTEPIQTSTGNGVTPTAPNFVTLIVAIQWDSSGGSFSDWSLTTDNPTPWVEILDTGTPGSTPFGAAGAAYSPKRPQTTATGDFLATFTGNPRLAAFVMYPTPDDFVPQAAFFE